MADQFPKQQKRKLPSGPGSKIVSYGNGEDSNKMRMGSSEKSQKVPSNVVEVKGKK